ncbi:MAG: hypothetical protein ACLSFT_00595 [Ruminococcus callidus]
MREEYDAYFCADGENRSRFRRDESWKFPALTRRWKFWILVAIPF